MCVYQLKARKAVNLVCTIKGKLPVIKTRDQRVFFREHMLIIQTHRCDLMKMLLLNISREYLFVLCAGIWLTPHSLELTAPNSRLWLPNHSPHSQLIELIRAFKLEI